MFPESDTQLSANSMGGVSLSGGGGWDGGQGLTPAEETEGMWVRV